MKRTGLSKPVLILPSRWLAYAAAGVATSLSATGSADAGIHYSGPLNLAFDGEPGNSARHRFPLNEGSAYFGLANLRAPQPWTEYGMAGFLINAPVSARFAATSYGVYRWVSQLASGDNLSARRFLRNKFQPGLYFNNKLGNIVRYYFNYGHWEMGDTGFVAFKFNAGAGVQYGWVRLHIEGQPPLTGNFTLIDYAYGDPGDKLVAGQTASAPVKEQPLPKQGSLGLLSLGAAGLLAWRRRRESPLSRAFGYLRDER